MSFLFWLICGIMGHGQLQGGSIIGYWSRTVTGSWLSEMCHFHGISLVQFSHSVVFDSLQPHGLQHARPPCPSPTPRACLNSCPLNRWCHPTVSSCVVPFSSCLQSFPKSESFLMSQFFTSCGQSIEASGFSNSLCNEYSGLTSFRIDWLDLLKIFANHILSYWTVIGTIQIGMVSEEAIFNKC